MIIMRLQKKPNPQWHTRNVSYSTFHKHLPSRQIATLLFIVLESGYLSISNTSKINGLVKGAHSSVQSLFSKHQEVILSWTKDKNGFLFSEEMKTDFINCCREDYKILTTLEIISNTNPTNFQEHLPRHLLNRIDQEKSIGFFAKIRKSISQIYLLDILWF